MSCVSYCNWQGRRSMPPLRTQANFSSGHGWLQHHQHSNSNLQMIGWMHFCCTIREPLQIPFPTRIYHTHQSTSSIISWSIYMYLTKLQTIPSFWTKLDLVLTSVCLVIDYIWLVLSICRLQSLLTLLQIDSHSTYNSALLQFLEP